MADHRLATFRLNKKRRVAALETSQITGQPKSIARTRALRFPGKTVLRVSAPTFSGTKAVRVAPGVQWSIPPDWDVFGSYTRTPSGIYVVEPNGKRIHCLRVNEFGQVEEVTLPVEVEAEVRDHYHIE